MGQLDGVDDLLDPGALSEVTLFLLGTSKFQVDNAIAHIPRRRTEEGKEGLLEELRRTHAALISLLPPSGSGSLKH